MGNRFHSALAWPCQIVRSIGQSHQQSVQFDSRKVAPYFGAFRKDRNDEWLNTNVRQAGGSFRTYLSLLQSHRVRWSVCSFLIERARLVHRLNSAENHFFEKFHHLDRTSCDLDARTSPGRWLSLSLSSSGSLRRFCLRARPVFSGFIFLHLLRLLHQLVWFMGLTVSFSEVEESLIYIQ